MGRQSFKNDMTMMYAMHDALRRDLERIVGIVARPTDDPAHVLRTAAGWEMFKAYLHVHHISEDVALWPVTLAFKNEWQPAYAALSPWAPKVEPIS